MAHKLPTELTEKLRQEICNNVLIGMPPRAAAEQAGVDREEFAEWTRRGRKGEEPFAGLLRAMKTAELTAQRHLVASVSKAAGRDPKVALQVLALRWPEEWTERGRERSVQLEVESRSAEEIQALASRMAPRFPLLHWESREEFEALIVGLLTEHAPQGLTEEHLVEELAGIVQRRNRFRLAEAASHRQGLKKTFGSYRETVHAALAHLGETKPVETVSEALTASSEESAAALAQLHEDDAVVSDVVGKLRASDPISYEGAQTALAHRRNWWDQARAEDGYKADAKGLLKYLEQKVLPFVGQRILEIESHPLIRAQAFGESFDAKSIEYLRRIESYLDRKFETTLGRLLQLRELRLAKAS